MPGANPAGDGVVWQAPLRASLYIKAARRAPDSSSLARPIRLRLSSVPFLDAIAADCRACDEGNLDAEYKGFCNFAIAFQDPLVAVPIWNSDRARDETFI